MSKSQRMRELIGDAFREHHGSAADSAVSLIDQLIGVVALGGVLNDLTPGAVLLSLEAWNSCIVLHVAQPRSSLPHDMTESMWRKVNAADDVGGTYRMTRCRFGIARDDAMAIDVTLVPHLGPGVRELHLFLADCLVASIMIDFN